MMRRSACRCRVDALQGKAWSALVGSSFILTKKAHMPTLALMKGMVLELQNKILVGCL